jgi:hypothetical protein
MTRVSIERIVVDAGWLDSRDAESFRVRLQDELRTLIEAGGLSDRIATMTRLDAGELPSSSVSELPRAVAEQVVRSLGGKS